jgi:Holliday junction resolvase RusA-like endonuclease
MTAGISIRAHGKPIPQGSKQIVRGRMIEANKHLRPWRRTVRAAAEDAARYHDTITTPVFVRATFLLERPAGHYGTGRNASAVKTLAPAYPCTRTGGDLDKLVRACLDALTDAAVWADDSLVVDLRARKVWTDDRPGVHLDVIPLDQEANA